MGTRLLLEEKPPPGGGGGSEAKKIFLYPNRPQISGPLINFIFCRRKIFLMLGGGGVGRPGLARAPNPPPPPFKGP